MFSIGRVETEIEALRKTCQWGSFEYLSSSWQFNSTVTSHFRDAPARDKHGVYIVRQKETGEILYIGKGGTVGQQGTFASQDIPGRLKAVRESNLSANHWFGSLLMEKGPLVVEYYFLKQTPVSPVLIESMLLQAYLNEHGCLPYRNSAL